MKNDEGNEKIVISHRRAGIEDIGIIRDIARHAFPATYRDILSPEQLAYMMEWMYSEESLRRQMGEEGQVFFLALFNGRPCGYVSIERQEEDLFHLQKIYLSPDFQGIGLGHYLFETALEHIRRVHPSPCRMELNVNRHNSARRFYERMGMTCLRSGDFDIGNGFFMNDYIMGMEIGTKTDLQRTSPPSAEDICRRIQAKWPQNKKIAVILQSF